LQLKKHGIHRLIVMGLIAHTCVEATDEIVGTLASLAGMELRAGF
jgi:hypothetical protein